MTRNLCFPTGSNPTTCNLFCLFSILISNHNTCIFCKNKKEKKGNNAFHTFISLILHYIIDKLLFKLYLLFKNFSNFQKMKIFIPFYDSRHYSDHFGIIHVIEKNDLKGKFSCLNVRPFTSRAWASKAWTEPQSEHDIFFKKKSMINKNYSYSTEVNMVSFILFN
jgi:hypothetical protein